jgi:hypothetical protein
MREQETIELVRGETLHMRIEWTDEETGDPVLPDGTWAIEALAARKPGEDGYTDLGPVITDGVGTIDFVTTPLAAGTWYFDIKLRDPAGEEVWGNLYCLKLGKSITPPAA